MGISCPFFLTSRNNTQREGESQVSRKLQIKTS